MLSRCTGSGWDEVNLLHRSPYGAVLSLRINQCWWYVSVLAGAEQCLYSVKAACFSLCHHHDLAESGREVVGDSRQVNHRDNPCHATSCWAIQTWGLVFAQRLTAHQSACKRWWMLPLHHLVAAVLLFVGWGFYQLSRRRKQALYSYLLNGQAGSTYYIDTPSTSSWPITDNWKLAFP